MVTTLPSIAEVRLAVDVYLDHAYAGAPPPARVQNAIEQLAAAGEMEFFQLPVWECDVRQPLEWFALRLGNRIYPHMKLALGRRPDRLGYVFRADPHDEHVTASLAAWGHEGLEHVVKSNREIAGAIEAAWRERGLATVGGLTVTSGGLVIAHVVNTAPDLGPGLR